MARTYAKVYVSIWAGDFRDLSIGAQGLYFRLMTDPKLSMCGVVDWRPRRLVQSFGGMSLAELDALARELQAARYIVIDEDTEEALVRAFVRYDGVLKSPNLTKAMTTDWLAVSSQKIKDAVVGEVRRALESEPDLKGSESVPDWFPKCSEVATDDEGGNPSESVPAEFPDPATCNLQPATTVGAAASRKKPATRMPDDWKPSAANLKFANDNGIDWQHELGQFISYHQAKDTRFADWSAGFRTWLGRAPRNTTPAATLRTADGMAREKTW